jgi:DNA-binding CsgD family transcriptional regulator
VTLTDRQLAALGACLDADSPKQAAHALGVSHDRLRHILHDLYRELGVHSRGDAVVRLDERFPGWRTTTTRRTHHN